MSLFKKIIDREIPAEIVYEDELCLAFKDINPQAPEHVLLIPKKEIVGIDSVEMSDEKLLGHLMLKVRQIAEDLGLEEGYRVVINNKDFGGQTVPHLHLHILGGRPMSWPPG